MFFLLYRMVLFGIACDAESGGGSEKGGQSRNRALQPVLAAPLHCWTL